MTGEMQVGRLLRKVVTEKQVGSRGGSGGNEFTFFKNGSKMWHLLVNKLGHLLAMGPSLPR